MCIFRNEKKSKGRTKLSNDILLYSEVAKGVGATSGLKIPVHTKYGKDSIRYVMLWRNAIMSHVADKIFE